MAGVSNSKLKLAFLEHEETSTNWKSDDNKEHARQNEVGPRRGTDADELQTIAAQIGAEQSICQANPNPPNHRTEPACAPAPHNGPLTMH